MTDGTAGQEDPGIVGVEPLSRLAGWQVAPEAPDVRGWEVTSPAFSAVGVVQDLHVDLRLRCVRYLEVELTDGPAAGRRVLLPIGLARIDDVLDRIIVATPSSLDGVPAVTDVDGGPLQQEFEAQVLDSLGAAPGDGAFYDCPAFSGTPFLEARRARLRRGDGAGDLVSDHQLVEDSGGARLRVVAPR